MLAPETSDGAGGAALFLSRDLPDLLDITGNVNAMLPEVLAAVLTQQHVFDGLSERDAKWRGEHSPGRPSWPGQALADAAAAVTERAIAAQPDRNSDFDDRMAVGLALHRAARVLQAREP